jgi:hypothetical protein
LDEQTAGGFASGHDAGVYRDLGSYPQAIVSMALADHWQRIRAVRAAISKPSARLGFAGTRNVCLSLRFRVEWLFLDTDRMALPEMHTMLHGASHAIEVVDDDVQVAPVLNFTNEVAVRLGSRRDVITGNQGKHEEHVGEKVSDHTRPCSKKRFRPE